MSIKYFAFFLAVSAAAAQNAFPLLKLLLIDRSSDGNLAEFPLSSAKDIASHAFYSRNLPTAIYCFGYTETRQSPLLKTVISAYVKGGQQNLIVVDFGKYASVKPIPSPFDYLAVIDNVKLIAPLVGEALWSAFGDNLERLQLVGHSIGAHLCAYINRAIAASQTNTARRKIPIIVGLDPAGPLFWPYKNSTTENKPLEAADARIVHVIHTDKLFFGAPVSLGTIDFWPNGGLNQSNCPPVDPVTMLSDANNFCSHQRSVLFFAEAISQKRGFFFNSVFLAKKCASWEEFTAGSCYSMTYRNMGDVTSASDGNFYLQTDSKPPYSLGFSGLFYRKTAKT